jgi:uncharacterized membrane protein
VSLETGKKLGFAASIINLVTPIVIVAVYVGFFVSLLSSIPSTISGGYTGGATNNYLSSLGFLGAIIGLCIVSSIGYIFYMVSMYNLSKYYHEPGIFRNLIKAFLITIVGSVIAGIVLVATLIISIGTIAPAPTSSTTFPIIWNLLIIIGMIGGMLAIGIYSVVLTRRAFNLLADKSGVDNFRTAGLLFLIGIIIPLVAWIGWIFAAMGYRKLTPTPPANAYFAPQYVTSPNGPVKRCPNCGTTNNPDAIYCLSCGKQFS